MKRSLAALIPIVGVLMACEAGPSGGQTGQSGGSAAAPAPSAPSAKPTPPPTPKPTPPPIVIAEGTPLVLSLRSTVSTASAKPGDVVSAALHQPIVKGDRVLVPEGAEVRGKVVTSVRPGKVKGKSHLVLEFESLEVKGRAYDIAATPIDITGDNSKKRDAALIGGGAGAGAIIGGIVDGGKGAAIGALIGGAAGGGTVLATRGKDIVLEPGQQMRVTLRQPVQLR
jgi:hypothetical protein